MPRSTRFFNTAAVASVLMLSAVWSAHTAAQAPAKAAPLQAQTSTSSTTFTALTANLEAGSADKIKINVFRWTPEPDRTRVVAAFNEKDDKPLLDVLQSQPSAGYVWTDESLGYSIRYAFRQEPPSGGERIVLVTDRPLGSWSGKPWKGSRPAEGAEHAYTVIELRLAHNGVGEGKMSLAAKVAVDQQAKTLALENFEAAPVTLRTIKREAPVTN